jgi:glycosyltransferase involved in cell wall biosynthesis
VITVLHVADAVSIHTRRWAEYHRDCGHNVHVASFRPAAIAGVTVHRLSGNGLGKAGYVTAIPMLRSLYRRIRPDIAHAQYVTSYGFLAAVARLHPLVVTAWGTDVLVSPRESAVLRALATYAVRHADAVTTVAEHMNPHVAALGVPLTSIEAVPFGVDTDRFRPRRLPRTPGPPRVVCTRNFEPVYDVSTLVRAMAIHNKTHSDWTLDLVGQGPLRATLEADVAALGLDDKVRFRGHVAPTELASLLADADIFVSPARSDGNNVSLNEAMACGCFPIATRIPANAQWLEHGRNGLLFGVGDAVELANCLRSATQDRALCEQAAVVNRNIVETRADWRRCVARMDEIYQLVIDRARGAAA